MKTASQEGVVDRHAQTSSMLGSNKNPSTAKRLESEIHRAEERTAEAIDRMQKTKVYQKEFGGRIVTENENEKTHKIKQQDLVRAANQSTARKQFNLNLPVLGPYMCDYSTNGSGLLLGGRKGHISAMRWKSFSLQSEIQLNEPCSAIKYLHDEQLYAVAQSKYTYIYGNDGVEVHQLRDMANVEALEFLPQHFLLTGGGKSGVLTWLDVSTGKLVSLRRSRLGRICQLRRDKATNVLAAGHQSGLITMWAPSCRDPLVKLAAHRSMVTDQVFDKSGTYMTTMGVDGYTRIWDLRTMRPLNQIYTPSGSSLDVSYTNLLAVGFGSRIEIWNDVFSSERPKKPFLTHNFEKGYTAATTLRFCPFEDVLGVSHNFGFTSLLVPGAGCAEPDFYSANPFETRKQMRDRPVHLLLDKLPPESIRMNNAPGASYMKPRNAALLKQKQLVAEIQDISENLVPGAEDQANLSDDGIIEKEVAEKRVEDLAAEAERLERQHKHERKLKKMNGVERYKLKQRTQGRKETRETRRSIKKKRVGENNAPHEQKESQSQQTPEKAPRMGAAKAWFSQV